MSQAGDGFLGIFPRWNVIVTGVVPFVIFLIAGTAELNRPPFDLVEAEQELVGGFHTEYSSIRFALFFLAEFMNTVTMSAIIVTLFLGGPAGPTFFGPAWIWGPVWFLAKLLIFLFMFVWLRATLPRFRYDQLMDLGWKVLIPLSLGLDAPARQPQHRPRSRLEHGGRRGGRVRRHRRRRTCCSPRPCAPPGDVVSWPTRRSSADGLPRGLQGHLREDVQGHGVGPHRHRALREGLRPEAREAGAPPRPPRAQPVRGRHGEVHRL